jgi:ABC-type dipeptide/oligopeptide/nickel transport system permease component
VSQATYIAKRVSAALFTIFVAATLNFLIFHLAPGNAAQALSRVPGATPQLQHILEREFGLNESLVGQYGHYILSLGHGRLGVSYQNQLSVVSNLRSELSNTIPMVLAGTVFAVVIGIAVGVVAGARRSSAFDLVGISTSMVLYSLPAQWVGLVLIVIFGGILPTQGRQSFFLLHPSVMEHWLDVGRHMILPSLTFGLVLLGQFALIARSSMVEVLGEDYILTARAKGVPFWRIIRSHALPNALLPTVTLTALSLGAVVGGAILVEVVFSWPGIGQATYQAVTARDYPMLEGQFLTLSGAVVVCNLLADLLYFRLDPRVRR